MSSTLRIVVVTGLSGAGKSTALRVLEDLGFYCVDNLPTPLVVELARMAAAGGDVERVALGIDTRGLAFGRGGGDLLAELRGAGHEVSVLFFDASDEAIVRRFSETRRPHPLAEQGGDVLAGVAAERATVSRLRAQADEVVDTTLLTVHQLRRTLTARFGPEGSGRQTVVRILSFGFRYGVPVDADLVFDVRFLPNPYFVPELKHQSGLDGDVAEWVLRKEDSKTFLAKLFDLLGFLLPLYRREGKSYLTVALGCTGGRHRSVVMVEEVARHLGLGDQGTVLHRDLNRHQGERMASRDEGTP